MNERGRPLQTPCRRICRQDREAGHCVGCGRTAAEIFAWFRMSDEERDAISRLLPERLTRLEVTHDLSEQQSRRGISDYAATGSESAHNGQRGHSDRQA
ncbi:DUF1289 domain-containing protein [Pseudochelatococcus sp. B33]